MSDRGDDFNATIRSVIGFDPAHAVITDRQCEGKCGTVLRAPGVVWCKACLAREESASARRVESIQLRPALESIPVSWRWARLDSDLLRDRVRGGERVIRHATRGRPWPRGATIVGAGGAGKTSLACAMFCEWSHCVTLALDDRVAGRFVSARMVPQTRDRFAEDYFRFMRAPMLVLDDVGAEGDTPTARAAVADLISERHSWDRPTIVTTWHNAASITSRYGDGIARRMFELALVIDFNPEIADR